MKPALKESLGSETIQHDSRSERHLFSLLLLAGCAWLVVYARFSLAPLQELIQTDLQLSDNQVALLQGPAFAVPLVLCSIPMGLLLDRRPRVPLIQLFLFLCVAAVFLSALAKSLLVLIIARGIIGCAVAVILVAAYSAVGDLYGPTNRGRATTIVSLGENVAAPAAFGLGGLLTALSADEGTILGVADWNQVLLWMTAPMVPIILFMLALREPARSALVVLKPPLSHSFARLWACRRVVLPLLFARVLVWIADGAAVIWGAPAIGRGYGLSPDRVGAIMAAALLVGCMFGPLFGGPLADLCQRAGGPRRTMAVMGLLALISAPAGLFAIMPSAAWAGVALGLLILLGYLVSTTALALSITVIPAELRGLYLGLAVTVGATVSIGAAPLMVSGLAGMLGGPDMIGLALALLCGGLNLLGAFVFGFGSRYYPGFGDGVASSGLAEKWQG